ncbi:hypothetical protein VIG_001686 [Vibrio cholerae INDRE 91/1]|nr:hypothetical protein VIG_001686 [Vibrio cholerae INDRE 91/1]
MQQQIPHKATQMESVLLIHFNIDHQQNAHGPRGYKHNTVQ